MPLHSRLATVLLDGGGNKFVLYSEFHRLGEEETVLAVSIDGESSVLARGNYVDEVLAGQKHITGKLEFHCMAERSGGAYHEFHGGQL